MTDRAASLLKPLILLWLTGVALRLTILATPPVVPLIQSELGLNATAIGVLTGLPPLLFALAAVPGSLVIARLGIRSALVLGTLACALFGALRGAVPSILWLDAMTIAMSAGVAVMQVALPPAVRAWTPARIPFATAIYTNGLLVGEILPAALMLPLILPLVGTWQNGFAFWSVPAALIAIAIWIMAPADPKAARGAKRRWWPDWRSGLLWRLGIMLGTANALYFASNGFLPAYLTARGEAQWISAALTSLNLVQLPASFLLLIFAERFERKAWPLVATGAVSLIALAAIVWGSAPVVVAAAGIIGFCCAVVLVLVLPLPSLLAAPDDVHRLTAAMFTISYTCAVATPIVSGLCWDATGVPAMAFAPIAICALGLMILAPAVSHAKPYGG